MLATDKITWVIEVGVALSRPPREDITSWLTITTDDDNPAEATKIALQMAHRPDVVMPVRATILSVEL